MIILLTQTEHKAISCITRPMPTWEHSKLFNFISRSQSAALIMDISGGYDFYSVSICIYLVITFEIKGCFFFPRCGSPGREGFASVSERLFQFSGIWGTEQRFSGTTQYPRVHLKASLDVGQCDR